jgi:hypothetical protein
LRNEKVITEQVQEEGMKHYAEDFIFIDEAGIWEGMERSKIRAERGRPRNHRKKYTIVGAISSHRFVCHGIIKGSMKGEILRDLLKKMCAPD